MSSFSKKPITISPGTAVVRISPLGFRNYAESFLVTAAPLLRQSNYSPVPYYLVCHAIELGLKAFLLAHNFPMSKLKSSVRHNLDRALTESKQRGLGRVLSILPELSTELAKANVYYASKGFEYFEAGRAARGYPDLPKIAVLHRFAKQLLVGIESACVSAAK